MHITGWASTLIFCGGWIFIGLLVWLLVRAGKKETQQMDALMQKGAPGNAKIIEVGASRTGRSDQKMHVALRLEVVPQVG
jgi:hypothetical protein